MKAFIYFILVFPLYGGDIIELALFKGAEIYYVYNARVNGEIYTKQNINMVSVPNPPVGFKLFVDRHSFLRGDLTKFEVEEDILEAIYLFNEGKFLFSVERKLLRDELLVKENGDIVRNLKLRFRPAGGLFNGDDEVLWNRYLSSTKLMQDKLSELANDDGFKKLASLCITLVKRKNFLEAVKISASNGDQAAMNYIAIMYLGPINFSANDGITGLSMLYDSASLGSKDALREYNIWMETLINRGRRGVQINNAAIPENWYLRGKGLIENVSFPK